jgi:hypothetical protein
MECVFISLIGFVVDTQGVECHQAIQTYDSTHAMTIACNVCRFRNNEKFVRNACVPANHE